MGTSLANLGDLTKPATVLIEKISDAIGGIAKPWQVQRVAKAEAKADVVRAQARIEISEIEERALQRMVREEGKRQDNIEQITAKSIPLLSGDAKSEDIEDDWISNFFEKGRLISDADMQHLWASMLAGEANKPGSYSKRTVELVSTLDKQDAELFTKFCSVIWMIGGMTPLMLFDYNEVLAEEPEINFSTISHLSNIGLIQFQSFGGFQKKSLPDEFTVFYFGKHVRLKMPIQNSPFPTGSCLLTAVGSQLANISGARPNPAFYDRVISYWTEQGFSPCEPLPIPGQPLLYRSWYLPPEQC